MKYLQNLHTHSTYCDGKNPPRDMVLTAIEKGFDSVGFSSHAHLDGSEWSIKAEEIEKYKNEIRSLKEEFCDKIDILLGIEYDTMCKPEIIDGYDYVIGATHYVLDSQGQKVDIDNTPEFVREVCEEHFEGDPQKITKAYFEKVASLADLKNIDIVAHFDVIAKVTENGYYLDRNDKTFLSYGYEAISALKGKVPFFELNVGAIARKRALCAYPNEHFIREFKNQGFGAVITTDCHSKEDLDGGMPLAREILKSCGYKEIYVLRNGSFEPIPIED